MFGVFLFWAVAIRRTTPSPANENIEPPKRDDATATVASGVPPNTAAISPATDPKSTISTPSVLASKLAIFADSLPAGACLVVYEGNARSIAQKPDTALIPASTLKLFTAVAAINVLGFDHHFITRAVASKPAVAGRLVGDLVLVGDGDPVLSTSQYQANQRHQPALSTSLEVLADRIRQSGITTVTGSVVGDERKFAADRFLPSWGYPYDYTTRTGPLSALELDDGWATANDVQIDPAKYAASILQNMLVARGIAFGADARSGATADQQSLIAKVDSPSVGDIVEEMLRNSDNMTAELLAKNIDAARHGPGTITSAATAVRTALVEAGFSFRALRMNDASGTDPGNQSSCEDLIRIVNTIHIKTRLSENGFAIAGRTGTLSARYNNTPAQDRVHAKTGSITGVASMTGYVDPKSGTTNPSITFAIIINNVIANKKYAYEDDLIDLPTL